jgi:predicted aminopeptidase
MNSSSIARLARAACLAATVAMLPGCYLMQAAAGQMAVMAKRRPIPRVIADPATAAPVRSRLAVVDSVRRFATAELHLPDNGSYRQYADIQRPYVVWNVVAAPEFSVQPRRWCFPVAGCVAYRGYFKQARAERFAASLRTQGFDVMVGGVAAYSTLGHFDDPILNTMLGWSDAQLAAIVFHELTHQLIYIKGDSDFNEALATAVEHEGVIRWLRAAGREAELAEWREFQERTSRVNRLLQETLSDLRQLYLLRLAPQDMRRRKGERFEKLVNDYRELSAGWGASAPYRGFFMQPLNNAHLAAVATYYRCVPGFQRLLQESGGDLPRFYERVRALVPLPAGEREQRLCGAP